MKRAAIYARFSSDLQNDRSIEDQIALCRTICERSGCEVVAVYQDRALSGTSTARRNGFLAMMQAASAGIFELIVAEDVDRIARDQADWHAARKRLDFLRVKVHTPGGVVGRLDGSVRAMMAEHFIENLAIHVRRGMAGVVRDGRNAGGKANAFARLFAVPGVTHCGGGVGLERFDALTALADWVEKGTAPDLIAASVSAANQELPASWSRERTRPLCPWPAYARYVSGDPEKAASFECAKP